MRQQLLILVHVTKTDILCNKDTNVLSLWYYINIIENTSFLLLHKDYPA